MNPIGQLSFAMGGLAFLALAVALLTVWRGKFGALLLAAVLVTSAWCLVLGIHARYPETPALLIISAELARDIMWLVFLVSLIHGQQGRHNQRINYAIHGIWGSIVVVTVGVWIFAGQASISSVFVFSAFLLVLAGLVVTEQVYRNSLPDTRWAIKFLCLGIAGIFVFDLVLFAKALMFRGLDENLWDSRGAIHALVAPLMAMSIARSPKWSPDLFLSRQMAFYTTSLFGAGVYLLAMAAGGYYVRLLGGEWGVVAQAIFVFGAVLLLLVLFFSGQFRARVKVFLNKHFFSYKYDYREEWLRLTSLLSPSADGIPLRERAIMSLANPVESPGGALWLRQSDGTLVFASRWNLHVDENALIPAASPMIELMSGKGWIVDLNEWAQDRSRYEGLEVPQWLHDLDKAWLVVPLMRDEEVYGLVVLEQSRAPQKLTWEDLDLLKTVAQHVAGYLALEEAAALLAEASQFQAFNRFTAFIMHDLKNLIAQQSLVVRNAARHKSNPEFIEDAINTVDNSVRRMSRLLEQLQQGETGNMTSRVSIVELCQEVAQDWSGRGAAPTVVAECNELSLVASRERLLAVLGHIVRNAQDAAGAAGKVEIRLTAEEGWAVIEVADNGPGMDQDFVRNRLFRPFESTKGSKGMGIGAYQAREFARSLGGDVEVYSKIGQGTRFRLLFPVDADSNSAAAGTTGALS